MKQFLLEDIARSKKKLLDEYRTIVQKVVIQQSYLEQSLSIFRNIQGAQMGSIGTLNNVYLPQLDRKKIDKLAEEINELL
jgi:hypothetical protein